MWLLERGRLSGIRRDLDGGFNRVSSELGFIKEGRISEGRDARRWSWGGVINVGRGRGKKIRSMFREQ